MLDALNREVQRRLFSEENPEILISFLNQCFFKGEEKVVALIGMNVSALSFVRVQSCFQDNVLFTIKTSLENEWVVQLCHLKLHKGRDRSLVKMDRKYFETFMESSSSYAHKLSLLYIGLLTFDTDELNTNYTFPPTEKNSRIDLHFLNLETWKLPQNRALTSLEQWMYVFKKSKSFTSRPNEITDKNLIKAFNLLDENNWNKGDLEDYHWYENLWEQRNKDVIEMYKEMDVELIDKYLETPATKVDVTIMPLFHQLIKREVNVKIEILNEKEARKIAFNIFKKWLKKTNERYPKFNIVIEDERPIVEDFKSTLTGALQSLILSDTFYTKFTKGWDIGYVIGYMTGSLGQAWHHEYVIKQTNDFKVLTVMQTLRDYLKFNDTANIQLKHLYENFISESVNVSEFDPAIELNDFVYKGQTIKGGREIGKDDTMIIALENMINTQIHKVTKLQKFKAVEFDIDDVVADEIIKNLIEENKLPDPEV